MIGKDIGLMKLEHEIQEAVFISPKVYGFITTDNKIVVKVKGFNSKNITYDSIHY